MNKNDLRAAALTRRDALTDAQREAVSQAIAARELPVALTTNAVVAGFQPIRSEIDPRPLMMALQQRDARLALPVITARGQSLIFRLWTDATRMRPGQFGILEPSADAPELVPDILLVPLAAFDRAGHRIGYGAGYYDRTLTRLRAVKPVLAIGIAFAVQEIDRVPASDHDAALDLVLTETETIDFRSSSR